MMADTADYSERLGEIFFPLSVGAYKKIREAGSRFVHYTSAEAALSIIRNGEMWMRKSTTMNDFTEVEHGYECVISAYHGEAGNNLKKALDAVSIDARKSLESAFDQWLPEFRDQTYLACLSEHDDAEDQYGRLSMWRAYGASTGVALVLNNGPLVSETDALNVYSSPVSYFGLVELEREFFRVAANINKNCAFLSEIESSNLVDYMFHMLRFAVLCTKHPGFKEEREWRLVHNPTYNKTNRVAKSVEVVRGVPQPVMKVPLVSYPDEGLIGLELNSLLNRLIIGPTQFPDALREAFCIELELVGVQNARSKVFVSDIPLR